MNQSNTSLVAWIQSQLASRRRYRSTSWCAAGADVIGNPIQCPDTTYESSKALAMTAYIGRTGSANSKENKRPTIV